MTGGICGGVSPAGGGFRLAGALVETEAGVSRTPENDCGAICGGRRGRWKWRIARRTNVRGKPFSCLWIQILARVFFYIIPEKISLIRGWPVF